MKRIVLLLVGWLGICTAVLGGVDVRSERLTVAEGLANNSVRCIYQDGKGFIWFGTLDGLNRYDGLSFLTFLPEKEMKIRLPTIVYTVWLKIKTASYGYVIPTRYIVVTICAKDR